MIDRRDFLKIAGCVVPYWGLIPVSNAQSIYSGKILVDIHASGGIDNSSWFDPREKDPMMNDYARTGTPRWWRATCARRQWATTARSRWRTSAG